MKNSKLLDLGTGMLRLLPPETAHDIGLKIIKKGWLDHFFESVTNFSFSGLKVNVPGIGELRHPIGLAAGFDKNGVAPSGCARLGFSFLEIGTVTPLAQQGNPKPRMFRLPDSLALINRMGFNSDGSSVVSERLRKLQWVHDKIPLGVNVGKNKTTESKDAVDDYVKSLLAFSDLAKYFVINISSPNTPNLRSLASPEFVEQLALRLGHEVNRTLVKLDPDQPKRDFQNVIEAIGKNNFLGVVLTNTHRVDWPQSGGLSGGPIGSLANSMLEWSFEVHRGNLITIAGGGIMSGQDALQRIVRGAHALQIYTAMIYRGPYVVIKILDELIAEMRLRGAESIEDLRGVYFQEGSSA